MRQSKQRINTASLCEPIAISVIIPIASHHEQQLNNLLNSLKYLPEHTEILFVGHLINNPQLKSFYEESSCFNIYLIETDASRAQALNKGALLANNKHLWFLHADSYFDKNAVQQLFEQIELYPDKLLYFKLAWSDAGKWYLYLNQLGANLRSRWLALPFGDQGLCMSRASFMKLNCYPNAPVGEDHLFVWQAHHAGIKLKRINVQLFTSARKYLTAGWCNTTWHYQKVWLSQAASQLHKMIRNKFISSR